MRLNFKRQALYKVYEKDGKIFADEYEASGYNWDDESFDYPTGKPVVVGRELVPKKIGYEIENISLLDERGIEEVKENGGACWYGLSKMYKFVGKIEYLEHRGNRLYGITGRDIRVIPGILMILGCLFLIYLVGDIILDLFI